jgi:D-alanine-D-alanine ligase
MAKLRVGVVFGGRSVEHEVSIASATSILAALDPNRYETTLIAISREGHWHLGTPDMLPASVLRGEEVTLPAVPGARQLVSVENGTPAAELDVIVPIVHGTGGEDGTLQGFLEMAGIPYVGAGVLGSAVQMDKDVAKKLLQTEDIPVVPWVTVRAHELTADETGCVERAVSAIGLPAFVKPANSGSSVGIGKVERIEEMGPALRHAAQYDAKVLVEQAIDAREIEVAVLGNDVPESSVPGEIVAKTEWYDYESKYVDEATELVVPADLSAELTEELREIALKAYRVLEGAGLARVDFFIERETDRIYLNEVNSLPGFTEASLYPRMWEASGLSYPALLDRLIELAIERGQARQALERTYRIG